MHRSHSGGLKMDFVRIKERAEIYKGDMTKFLRDIIAIPGESAEEERVAKRIAEESRF
jgi:acetylornithine deacetylase/succinyl-diaminopimelate desuccinylase-like protein